MTEQLSANDRRTDIINNLQIRLSVLEATHNSLMNTGLTHAALIDKLSNQDTSLVLSLNSISIKFDDLIKQIAMGIKIVLACTSAIVVIISAFYVFTKDLDERYSPKLESIVTNTISQKHKIDATSKAVTENTEKLNEQANQLEDVTGKVEQATGKIDDVSSSVTKIKKLKVVRGSR